MLRRCAAMPPATRAISTSLLTSCRVLGNNADSSDTRNYKTDITANVLQGDKRVKVCLPCLACLNHCRRCAA